MMMMMMMMMMTMMMMLKVVHDNGDEMVMIGYGHLRCMTTLKKKMNDN